MKSLIIQQVVEEAAAAAGDAFTNANSTGSSLKSVNKHVCPHGHDHRHQHMHHHHHHHQLNAPLPAATPTATTKSAGGPTAPVQPNSPMSSSSSSSDDWLPPPPPPFAAAAAYLIQQSMKNKANQNNYPHIDLDSCTESNHDTALTVACAGGHEELVKLLIEKGAHIEHRDKKGFTPLILAATLGYCRIVQLLLMYGADVEAQSERNKDTALSAAAQSGKYECCEILLAKGQANKEHRNISDYTPLSLAASGGYVNIIKLLLDYGAEINSRTGSKLGISPLMLAAMNGHTHAVRLLIEMGSDVNAQIETNRNTALTLACFQGRHDVVLLLVERKANIEHRAKSGLTPLMEAASGGYEAVGKVLLERGADVNASPVPTTKDTALTIAADKGHLKFVQLLIEYGAQLDAKNKKGCTALWLACHNGHLEVAQLLVMNLADTEAVDLKRVSCLMAAFRRGHLKLCKFMVKHVRQFPSDQDCKRFINSLTEPSGASSSVSQGSNGNQSLTFSHQLSSGELADKDLLKKCLQCMELIYQAKDKQTQEANRIATNLLKELDAEKSREETKKAAAQRKREKRKLKKQQQMQQQQQEEEESTKKIAELVEEAKKILPVVEIEEPQAQIKAKPNPPKQTNKKNKKKKKSGSNQRAKQPAAVVQQETEVETIEKPKSTESNMPDKKMLNLELNKSEPAVKPIQPPTFSSLASLDDFEQPVETANSKVTTPKVHCHKQRIVVPHDKFLRVMGRGNCNIKVIQEVTGALLELEDKKIPPHQDRSILIKADALDVTKYAFELLQALINDSDIDLLNLLPTSSNTVKPKAVTQPPVNKWNTDVINSNKQVEYVCPY